MTFTTNLGALSSMRCLKHKTEAVAFCVHCGRALCSDCIQNPSAARLVCSNGCANALAHGEQVIATMVQQGVRTAKASAFYCYLCAGLSASAAVVAWFMLPSPFLILFTVGCALVLILSGIWYGRVGARPAGSTP